jgi:protoporphyrin/coproporphyrin ferrochelatase
MKTQDHPKINHGKQGVLLINLGTPDSLSLWDIRKYLKQFLSDRRVIELNPLIWQPILRGIILNTRPFRTRRAYAKIWRKETDESPLRYYTRRQAEMLHNRIDHPNIIVDWAMRYGNPSIESRIHSLQQQGCESIVVLPLYPQYCAATTATVCDEVFRVLQRMRWQPQVQIVPRYYDHPDYIRLMVGQLERQLERLEWRPQQIVLSYHGVPRTYLEQGDPYHCQCAVTTRLIREAWPYLDIPIETTFQSRFGPAEWLQPYTDATLKLLPTQGIYRIMIATPGFVSDCVETLEEIGMEGVNTFREAHGDQCHVVPCVNDSPEHIRLLQCLIEPYLLTSKK